MKDFLDWLSTTLSLILLTGFLAAVAVWLFKMPKPEFSSILLVCMIVMGIVIPVIETAFWIKKTVHHERKYWRW